MISSNNMRFATDIFGLTTADTGQDDTPEIIVPFNKTALLISKQPLDCSNKSAVTGISISGLEPANTKRRFMFNYDGKNYKYSSGSWNEYTGSITADNVLKDGNTAAQISALTSVPAFVGKKIYPIIALSAQSDAEDFPTAKLSLQTQVASETLTKIFESIQYDLVTDDSTPRIVEISADVETTGGGSATLQVRLRNGSTWTSYMTLANAADKEAQGVQFKITYKVTTAGGADSVKVKSINVDHTLGKTVVSGNNADLYTVVTDYENDLQTCYATVRHDPLTDSRLEAYVNFMHPPETRELISIGIGTGSRQECNLGIGGVCDQNIDASTIQLFADGDPITNFSYNSESSTVVVKVKSGEVISASYKFNHDAEEWRQMTLERTEPYTDGQTYVSRFAYVLPDEETAGKTISNVRIKMIRPNGSVRNQNLGVATGKNQLFVLPHIPKASTIKFTQSVDFEYNEENNILSLVAAKNTALKISYSWVGESIIIYSLAAGWACA